MDLFKKSWLKIIFIGCVATSITNLQAKENYNIPRVTKAPKIDAVIDMHEWKDATQVELAFETNPGENIPASARTTVHMMEDGEFIYFAFMAYDPNPENILASFRDRDRIFQDDFVGIKIDTFNDERRAFELFVNPLGAQADLTVSEDRGEDTSWDAVWESLGQVTKDGYVVEMAIPYRALRFPSGKIMQKWGVEFLRIYPRDDRKIFSDVKRDRNNDCGLCQINKVVGMPNLKTGRNIDVTPTLTSVRQESRDPVAGPSWNDAESDVDVGVDLRWAMTENWILNATLNPDFSQISADAAQLDINNTFSLFYSEARPFFLDGAEYFSTNNRLVHTRNIADPDFGIKVTGKSDGHSAGVIIASDTSTSFLLPGNQGSGIAVLESDSGANVSSDVFVVRYQKDIGEKNSFGALVTHRGNGDYKNDVMAFDGKYYFTDSDSVSVQYMRSDSDNSEQVQADYGLDKNQTDSAYTMRLQRRKRNYHLRASYSDFGEDFRADMGFISKVDYTKVVLGGGYTWFGEKDNLWTRMGVSGDWDKTEDQSGKLLEEEYEMQFNITARKQFNMTIGLLSRDNVYGENDEVFKESNVWTWFGFKPTPNIRVGSFLLKGDSIDYANVQLGQMTIIEPFINWQVGKHFNIRTSTVFQTLKVPGGELFDASLLDVRLNYQFNIRSRLSLTLQGSDITRNGALYSDFDENNAHTKTFGTQLIYSYKLNPLSLVYLGYSDAGFQGGNLSRIEKSERSIFAKFSYMWQY